MTPAGSRGGAIVGIQALRVLAASMIAVYHFQHEAGRLAAAAGEAFAPLDWLPWTAGIDIFFVVSGFIMVHASARLFGAPGAAREFLARRVTRIVPLYWLATTAFIAVALLWPASVNGSSPGVAHIVASYLFIPMTGPDGNVAPVYSLGWTLNCEMFFYLVFAIFIGLRRELALVAVASVLVALVLFGLLAQPQLAPLRLWGQPVMLSFVAGMAIGAARAHGLRLPGWVCALLVALALALLVTQTRLFVPESALQAALLHGAPAALLVMGAGLAQRGDDQQRGSSVLSRLAVRLGDASYAIYLLHPFCGRLAARAVAALNPDVGLPLFFVCAFAATLVVSLAVHALVERPATMLLRGRATWPSRSKSLV